MTHSHHNLRQRVLAAVVVLSSLVGLSGCASAVGEPAGAQRLKIVATTGLLGDIAATIVGNEADVTSLVPPRSNIHSYEPSLRDIRDVAYADLAVSNGLMLEPQAVMRAVDANLKPGAVHLPLAECAEKYGATLISLVEDASLDAPWLGLRVMNTSPVAAPKESVLFSVTKADGPGHFSAYLTQTFGSPTVVFNSRDGFDASDGHARDTTQLPLNAHTHMSWAFTEAGHYRIHVKVHRQDESGATHFIAEGDLNFAVGIDPHSLTSPTGEHTAPVVVDKGHADLTTVLHQSGSGELALHIDPPSAQVRRRVAAADQHGQASPSTVAQRIPLSKAIVHVPTKSRGNVPAEPAYSFIARPGTPAYLLPQAVVGVHVHGRVDPHVWHDARNTIAMVKTLRDEIIARAPHLHQKVTERAETYIADLTELDATMTREIAAIPAAKRHLITTDDAYGYLASAYGLNVAGFVSANPSVEPSVTERIRLQNTLNDLKVPAVFLEPQRQRRPSPLVELAKQAGVQVCTLHGHDLTDHAPTYITLMRHNLAELRRCLS